MTDIKTLIIRIKVIKMIEVFRLVKPFFFFLFFFQ